MSDKIYCPQWHNRLTYKRFVLEFECKNRVNTIVNRCFITIRFKVKNKKPRQVYVKVNDTFFLCNYFDFDYNIQNYDETVVLFLLNISQK